MRAYKYKQFICEHGAQLIQATSLPYSHHTRSYFTHVVGTTNPPTHLEINQARKSFPSLHLLEDIYVLLNFVQHRRNKSAAFSGIMITERGMFYLYMHNIHHNNPTTIRLNKYDLSGLIVQRFFLQCLIGIVMLSGCA